MLVLPALAVVQVATTGPAAAGACESSSSNCFEHPLAVDVSAVGGYGVTYPWTIEKQVDRSRVAVDASTGEATFHYVVTVRAGEAQSAGWTLDGTIVVTNPNEDGGDGIVLTGAEVTTDLGGGAVCTPNLPDEPVVPAASGGLDGSLEVPFDCAFTGAPATSGAVAATVTWDPADPTEDGTSVGSGMAVLDVTSESDKVVDVIDDMTDPTRPVLLEEGLTWSPGLVKTYEYSLTLPGVLGECVGHTNTAIVDLSSTTDPTASTTATVCIPSLVTPPPTSPPPPPVPPVIVPPVPPAPPEVLPAQAFGKAVGKVRTSCQGTVRAKLKNRSGVKVTYKLRVGKKVHRIKVQSLKNAKFRTKGKARAKVTLKLGKRVLDRVRVPERCAPPEVLPATGLRPGVARHARSTGHR